MWNVCLLSNAILDKISDQNPMWLSCIAWTPQFQNFAIPPIWLSHPITQRYWVFYQSGNNFTNPTWFYEKGINYGSIIVTIISSITVLQCYLLWICLSIRRLLQLMVYIGVSTAPSQKHHPSANYPSPLL